MKEEEKKTQWFFDSSLLKLKALTESLPSFSDKSSETTERFIEIDMEHGVGFGWQIFSKPEISIGKWFSSTGSIFSRRGHPVREWIIVYDGKMVIAYEDDEKVLERGDFVFHESDRQHSIRFESDTWYLSVTIPNVEDWSK